MKLKPSQTPLDGGFNFDFSRAGKIHRNRPGHLVRGLTLGFSIALLAAVTGCVGVVDGDGDGAVVVAPDPGFLWYGDWGWGGGWRGYSHRGAESRGGGHGGGGGGHSVGGGGHGGGGHGGGGGRH